MGEATSGRRPLFVLREIFFFAALFIFVLLRVARESEIVLVTNFTGLWFFLGSFYVFLITLKL